MRELRRTLLAMRRINEQVGQAARRLDHRRSSDIVTLRQEFAEACGNFILQLQGILHDRENRALFIALQDEFEQMRSALQGHQIHWTPQAIAAEPDHYLQRKQIVARKVASFIERSLIAIADDLDAVA